MRKPLRIAFVHHRDARDVRSWSGTLFFSKAALQRHVGEVVDLSPAPIPLEPFRVARGFLRVATGKSWSYDHDPVLGRFYGRVFTRRLAAVQPDLIFCPAGAVSLAYLTSTVPILYYSDATFRVIRDYYAAFSNLTRRTGRAGEEIDRRVFEQAAVALFSSDWAAKSAVRDYGLNPTRVYNVGIGANLEHPPTRDEVLPRHVAAKLRLLFVAVRWTDKGGDIALRTLVHLQKIGIDAELTAVGCAAPSGVSHPGLRVIPFLNKGIPEQREQFDRLWREAHVFLLPTRFDASPVVLCEAAANGIPAFATRTGGVASLVREGENGYTLPPEADGEAYASLIAQIVSDPARYARLCETSRDAFEQRLNWNSWGQQVAQIVEKTFPQFRGRTFASVA